MKGKKKKKLTVYTRSKTANLFLAIQTAVNPDDLLQSETSFGLRSASFGIVYRS